MDVGGGGDGDGCAGRVRDGGMQEEPGRQFLTVREQEVSAVD